jgi:hypothetical protein
MLERERKAVVSFQSNNWILPTKHFPWHCPFTKEKQHAMRKISCDKLPPAKYKRTHVNLANKAANFTVPNTSWHRPTMTFGAETGINFTQYSSRHAIKT